MNNVLSRRLALVRTLPLLGWRNIGEVMRFRWRCRSGYFNRLQPVHSEAIPNANFWRIPDAPIHLPVQSPPSGVAPELLSGQLPLFASSSMALGDPPDWFAGAGNLRASNWGRAHWSDFFRLPWQSVDVKRLWDSARFGWALALARVAASSGDAYPLRTINRWIVNWSQINPEFSLPNWSCGQETALRLISVLLVDAIMEATGSKREPSLENWIKAHCCRIEATLSYAIAQRNNHAISEATSLYMAGAWLAEHSQAGENRKYGSSLQSRGRMLLESSVISLISDDGGFPLVSPTYHRAVLDLLAISETWRNLLGETSWPAHFRHRVLAAADWLGSIVDPVSGDAPNLGGNDGSMLLDWGLGNYRDFRVAPKRLLRVFNNNNENPLLTLLSDTDDGVEISDCSQALLHQYVGTVVLRNSGNSWALVRYHTGITRPQHCDSLHVDLWCNGLNLLRDGGSFDYSNPQMSAYFSGARAHNIIEFDNEDPMLRLGPFLFSDWLSATVAEFDSQVSRIKVNQIDRRGYRHNREVYFEGNTFVVVDEISGNFHNAVLRWRLAPAKWTLVEDCAEGPVKLCVKASSQIKKMLIVDGWESRYYGTHTTLPVLEVHLSSGPATIVTRVELQSAT